VTLNILLSFAQFEREVIGERIRDKFAASRARGMWMGGKVPLGYDVVKRKLVVNEEEAARIRRVFEIFAETGSGIETLRRLDTEGVRSKSGRVLDKGDIYKFLRNPTYLGEAAELLADGHAQRLGGLKARAELADMPAEQFGIPVLGDAEQPDLTILDGGDLGGVDRPHDVRCRGDDVPLMGVVAALARAVRLHGLAEAARTARVVGGGDGGRLFVRVFDGAANVRENIAGDVLASGTTMQWNSPAKGWNAGAVMADASLNRRQTIRVCAGVAFAQVGIVGFDGQIELEALRLFGLPEAAPAVLYGSPSMPIGTRSLALETTWDLPNLTAGATANIDVTVPGARRGNFADASLDTSSIAFVLDCHVWSNNSVGVTARNVSASTVDLAAAPLLVQVVKRRVP
jgi:hypothetical protein